MRTIHSGAETGTPDGVRGQQGAVANRTLLVVGIGVVGIAIGAGAAVHHHRSEQTVALLRSLQLGSASNTPAPAPTAREPFLDPSLGVALTVADQSVRRDLNLAATTELTYDTLHNQYTSSLADLDSIGFEPAPPNMYSPASPGVVPQAFGGTGYCLSATSATGDVWFYDSNRGGIQPPASSYTCSLAVPGAS